MPANQREHLAGINDYRLTLTSATPVTTADVTAATSIILTPFVGNRIALFDGDNWALFFPGEISVSIAGLAANTNFDVFVYDNAGTVTIEAPTSWTNDTTRATALVRQNGVWVRTGATTRRYVGTFRTTATIGQTEDSAARRFVFNAQNRVLRTLHIKLATASWTYTTFTYRDANADATYEVAWVLGLAEGLVYVQANSLTVNTSSDVGVDVGLSVDGAAVDETAQRNFKNNTSAVDILVGAWRNDLVTLGVGYHTVQGQERSEATGTTTWVGNNRHTYLQGLVEQ